MDYYDIIAESFQSTLNTIAMSVDSLAEPIEHGSQLITRALLQDCKVLACGNGVDAALAQLFTANLLDRHQQERPALPALSLSADATSLLAIAHSHQLGELFSRQVRALGQAEDVLLVINSDKGVAANLVQAVAAAQERNMNVLALSNSSDTTLGAALRQGDVLLTIDADSRPRIVELLTMALHALCALVDHNLFGAYNQE